MDGGRAAASNARRDGVKASARLSAAELDKRLGLRRRAREDAARDFPATDAEDLSPAERAVIEAAGAARAAVDRARLDAKAEAERRLGALTPPPPDVQGPALQARLALKQAAGRLAHDWRSAAHAAAQTRDDLAAFRQANKLRRAAIYPSSGLLQAGLLLSAAMFEALFSAALFAEDEARGLLGGAVIAVGLSGANVALGFLSGFLGLRYLQHVRAPVKAAGAAAFAAFALLALMLNLFAADWRDQMAALSGRQLELGADASFHLWSLLQLDSPQAIILLMLGGGVWVFAALKGYSGFDDPYPDYGKLARAERSAGEALSDFRAEARAELEAPIDAAKATLSARLEAMRAQFAAMSRAFDEAAQRIEALDAHARTIDEAAAAAVHLYRQENAAARSAPAPAYFSAEPPAAGPALDVLTAGAVQLDNARAALADAQTQANAALHDLLAELEETAGQFDSGGGA